VTTQLVAQAQRGSVAADAASVPELLRLTDPQAAAEWLAQRCTGQLRCDSRQLQVGDALLAWPGAKHDPRSFVGAALAAGAGAALVEAEGLNETGLDPQRVAAISHLKSLAGHIAAQWFKHPTVNLPVLAVTGTNGKTSCAWWLAQALSAAERRCGVIGTLGIGEPSRLSSTGLTTPDAVQLQSAFANFRSQGFLACAIEASSIGLVEGRLNATRIDTALFTNLTQDHLDYHGDMARYWEAKQQLFHWEGLRAAVINVDDDHGRELAQTLASLPVQLRTVSSKGQASLMATDVTHAPTGLQWTAREGAQTARVQTSLVGDFNVDNLMLVLGGLRAQGIPLRTAAQTLSQLTAVPGRLQRVDSQAGQPLVVVDYAHTPDALQKVLAALRPLVRSRSGALHCIFGCGGDRDPGKRPQMGALAAEAADRVVVTSDNPRSESAALIIEQIIAGVPAALRAQVSSEVDRRQAIAQTIQSAAAQDVVLIAGKGHEDYQEIQGQRLPFCDVRVATEALKAQKSLES
jgi:UDP-N-acetylmuramyl-tripeptide synthetase